MRAPLTPLKALLSDAASLGKGGSPGSKDDPRISHWLTVAQAAERLAGSTPGLRDEYAVRLSQSVLPERHERPTQIEGDGRAPTDFIGRLSERLRLEAEDMERAGCFELARTTVSFVCQMLTKAPYTANRLLATAHLGRVNRQLGDLNGAVDCYNTVTEEGQEAEDGPVAAHGFIGLGNVAHTRGNRPAQKSFFELALGLAAKGSPAELSAHQGLMIVATAQNKLADALLHGWRAHDLAPPGSQVQFQIISNLASTALKAGFYEAALAGFTFASQRSTAIDRIVAFGQGALAAARCGKTDDVDHFEQQGRKQITSASQSFDCARFFLWSAEARQILGQTDKVEPLVAESLLVAAGKDFHEVQMKAEALRAQNNAARSVATRSRRHSWRDASPDVQVGLGRLESLAAF